MINLSNKKFRAIYNGFEIEISFVSESKYVKSILTVNDREPYFDKDTNGNYSIHYLNGLIFIFLETDLEIYKLIINESEKTIQFKLEYNTILKDNILFN